MSGASAQSQARLGQAVARPAKLAVEKGNGFAVASPRTELAAFARCTLLSRRRRDACFPEVAFGEPSWDMMLDLYVQHAEGRTATVSDLCLAAGVPQSTALRWIRAMVEGGLFIRTPDTHDRRRVFVTPTAAMLRSLEAHLDKSLVHARKALAVS